MGSVDITFLSQEDLLAAGGLDMSLAVPTMEEVFRLHYKQDYVLPPKSVLRWGDRSVKRSREELMPRRGLSAARPAHFQDHLTPEISKTAVEALEAEKSFLLNSGFIDNDFSVTKWIDGSFLTVALKELAEEENIKVS